MNAAMNIANKAVQNRVASSQRSDVRKYRLFDSQLLPAGGVQLLSFFQQPIGSGVTTAIGGVVGTAKSRWDTNMTLGGQLPNGQIFVAETLEVEFFAGSSAAANTFTLAQPDVFAVAASATALDQIADTRQFYSSGRVSFNILSKEYVGDQPIGKFPPKTQHRIDSSLSSNSATVGISATLNGVTTGRPWDFGDVELTIEPNMNFSVNLEWPANVALPSGFNARVVVALDGWLIQAVQ
jgi:hypothetical protein